MAKFKKGDRVRLKYYDAGDMGTSAKNKAHAGEIAVVDEDGNKVPWIKVESTHDSCPHCIRGSHCWVENYMELVEDKPTLPENTVVHVKTEEEYNTLMRAYEKVGWRCGNGEPPASLIGKKWDCESKEALDGGSYFVFLGDNFFGAYPFSPCWSEYKTHSTLSLSSALEILKKVYPKEMEGFEESPLRGREISHIVIDDYHPNTIPSSGFFKWSERWEETYLNNPLPTNPTKMETLKQAIRGVSKSVRLRRKHGIEDVEGNLTRAGQEAYLQLLWEKDKEGQKRMDLLLKKLDKNEDTDEE